MNYYRDLHYRNQLMFAHSFQQQLQPQFIQTIRVGTIHFTKTYLSFLKRFAIIKLDFTFK